MWKVTIGRKGKKYGTVERKTCGDLLGMEDKWLQRVALSA